MRVENYEEKIQLRKTKNNFEVVIVCLTWFVFGFAVMSATLGGIGVVKDKISDQPQISPVIPEAEAASILLQQNKLITYADYLNEEGRILSSWMKKQKYNMPRSVADEIAYWVMRAAEKYNLPPSLLIGIIREESSFNPFAKNKKGAKGLMQILVGECNGQKLDSSRAFDIDYNIDYGACVFTEHLRIKKGNLYEALVSYVGGSQKYASDVLEAMGEYMLYRISVKRRDDDV